MFLTTPPQPGILARSLGKSGITPGFMRSMAFWAMEEYDCALDYHARGRNRKAYLDVKYRWTPAMVLAGHPLFREIISLPEPIMREIWYRLDKQTQKMFAYAYEYAMKKGKVH